MIEQGDRDYSLIGPSARRAAAQGLVAADWYHADVPRKAKRAPARVNLCTYPVKTEAGRVLIRLS